MDVNGTLMRALITMIMLIATTLLCIVVACYACHSYQHAEQDGYNRAIAKAYADANQTAQESIENAKKQSDDAISHANDKLDIFREEAVRQGYAHWDRQFFQNSHWGGQDNLLQTFVWGK